MTAESVWIPPNALAHLTEELARLATHPNPDRATLERVRELRKTLSQAEASIKPDDGLVEPGMRITAMISGDTRATVFLLGQRELVALDPNVGVDVYSPSSPVGQAIIGSRVGDIVTYDTPARAGIQIEILAAAPYKG
ncbi:hypothetical protein E3T26_10105 [Cryobacterium sp. TMT1-21]|uniref:Transcription elongation factor GreA/GreB C-terminal domain-containing protein n=1 Tax=Cryobacterium shii TaxID=1259235 RepID=A0AAQ2HEG7_9MICO|nr:MULTISPECIES: GreA/GreB family elongation factor [Cryobacterium]TFC42506.1 hypothetical protein E3O49_14245 [Cryobacterium shii]TFC80838.1 hypothetical protein E3T24_15790 [Cryobacterium sp. TmT2-59]TFD13235.1 hypothetical protein E3T26_10105 [Cryobacterium sp. TMT1-21]TFD18656.1 hypothetical protein E3T42_05395 [Cryobacterium sp. TMT4-10]TFD28457.1 hypothetical protein E3T32_00920 [Cryobacterium sp. TMT2-23]